MFFRIVFKKLGEMVWKAEGTIIAPCPVIASSFCVHKMFVLEGSLAVIAFDPMVSFVVGLKVQMLLGGCFVWLEWYVGECW